MSESRADHPPIAAPLGAVTTERLHLRAFADDDLDELAVVFAKPEVWRYPYGRGFSRQETEAFLRGQLSSWAELGFGLWAAIEQSTEAMLGFVGLSVPHFLPEVLPAVEVGWRLDPDAWGKGYATEGARAALNAAFTTLGLDDVVSVPQADNPASARVAERIGMTLERPVTIPANERRGALAGSLYRISRQQWSQLAAGT